MVSDRNKGSNGRIIAAVVGMILIGANPPSQKSLNQTTNGQAEKSADQEKTLPSAISRTGEALAAQNSKTDPNEKERNIREIRDLAAQEKSAYWAEYMFWATVAALILSFIGIVFVWNTFRETRKGNKIATDTLISENRAWLEVSSKLRPLHIGDQMMTMHNLELVVENIGNSVARNVACWASLHAIPDGTIISHKFDDLPEPSILRNDTLQNIWPGKTHSFFRDPGGLSPATKPEIHGHTFTVMLRIVVEYRTVFGGSDIKTTELVAELVDHGGLPFDKSYFGPNASRAYNVHANLESTGGGKIK